MISGKLLDIQRFCTDDGPGIRTAVFLKGCPLRCIWCHNPESQNCRHEIVVDAEKCIGCKACQEVCPQKCHIFSEKHIVKSRLCIGCGCCVRACRQGAALLYGKVCTANEVLEEVKKDRVFYEESCGGVTISGGEPLYQPEFTAEILRLCREADIHTAIETSGFAAEKALVSVVRYCDFILFDIKETNDALHKKYTGVSQRSILNNLQIINEMKIPFVIRAPIVPTLNDREEHFTALKRLQVSHDYCQGIEIMPYHRVGAYKYGLLNRENICSDIPIPTVEMIESYKKML